MLRNLQQSHGSEAGEFLMLGYQNSMHHESDRTSALNNDLPLTRNSLAELDLDKICDSLQLFHSHATTQFKKQEELERLDMVLNTLDREEQGIYKSQDATSLGRRDTAFSKLEKAVKKRKTNAGQYLDLAYDEPKFSQASRRYVNRSYKEYFC